MLKETDLQKLRSRLEFDLLTSINDIEKLTLVRIIKEIDEMKKED